MWTIMEIDNPEGSLEQMAEGYFIFYLDEKDDTAFYTFSVEYQGLFAEAEPGSP